MAKVSFVRLLACTIAALLLGAGLDAARAQSERTAPETFASQPGRNSVLDLTEMRRITLESAFLPKVDMVPVEALFARHANAAAIPVPCEVRVCVRAQSIPVHFPARPGDHQLTRLDFGSNGAKGLPDRPIDLILVIDRSGSMEGGKLAQVKRGLIGAIGMLRPSDRLGIVAFGETAELLVPLSDIGGDSAQFGDAIAALEAEGLTNVEEGLELGFREAMRGAGDPSRKHRVILLTDQWPNLDAGRESGFGDLASTASAQGIGLSTVGVHQRFDTALALRLAAIPGGRLLDWEASEDGEALIMEHFAQLASPPLPDMRLVMAPKGGGQISALYGVPGELVAAQRDGSVVIDVGGGFVGAGKRSIFASMGYGGAPDRPSGASADLHLTIVDFPEAAEILIIEPGEADSSSAMKNSGALVDVFLTVTDALQTYHSGGDIAAARRDLGDLRERIGAATHPALHEERQTVAALERKLRAIEQSTGSLARLEEIVGRWEVVSQRGLAGAAKGDLLEFTRARELVITRRNGLGGGRQSRQTFQLTGDRLLVDDTDLFFRIEAKRDRLTLIDEVEGDRLKLKRLR